MNNGQQIDQWSLMEEAVPATHPYLLESLHLDGSEFKQLLTVLSHFQWI